MPKSSSNNQIKKKGSSEFGQLAMPNKTKTVKNFHILKIKTENVIECWDQQREYQKNFNVAKQLIVIKFETLFLL